MADLSEVIAQHAVSTTVESLPSEAIAATKALILNTVGITLAGQGAAGSMNIRRFVEGIGGAPQASVLGTPLRVMAPFAAYANAVTANAHDYDDNYDPANVHVGTTVVSAVLAIAETLPSASGGDVITAVALGADVMCRLASARTDSNPKESEWNVTGLLAYFGCAAAASAMLQADPMRHRDALGLASTMASGSKQLIYDGVPKALLHGNAAKGGLLAALMAAAGIAGPRNSLEGPGGLFPLYYGGRYQRERALDGLGEKYLVSEVSLKPYPSCRYTHGYISAAIDVARRTGLQPDEIRVVRAHVCPRNKIIWEETPAKVRPRAIVDAQFSVRFAVANALVHGAANLSHYSSGGIAEPAVLAVLDKVQLVVTDDPQCPGMPPARIEVEMVDGRRHVGTNEVYKGAPANPMTFAELAEKTRECAGYAYEPISFDALDELIEQISDLERVERACALPALLARR